MWGYVARYATPLERRGAHRSVAALFSGTQALAIRHVEPYLVASTALSELSVYLRNKP